MNTFNYNPADTYDASGQTVCITGLDTNHAEITNLGSSELIAAPVVTLTGASESIRRIPAGATGHTAVSVYENCIYVNGNGSFTVREVNLDTTVDENRLIEGINEANDYTDSVAGYTNHIVNPCFSVNQRGQTQYSSDYTVDCWKIITANTGVWLTANGIRLGLLSDEKTAAVIGQSIERYSRLAGKTITVSVMISATTASQIMLSVNYIANGTRAFKTMPLQTGVNSFTVSVPESIGDMQIWVYGADSRNGIDNSESYTEIGWVKLEINEKATAFCEPLYSDELLRCQRYYQLHTTGDIDPVDLRPSMAKTPAMTQRSDGKYEYTANLF